MVIMRCFSYLEIFPILHPGLSLLHLWCEEKKRKLRRTDTFDYPGSSNTVFDENDVYERENDPNWGAEDQSHSSNWDWEGEEWHSYGYQQESIQNVTILSNFLSQLNLPTYS